MGQGYRRGDCGWLCICALMVAASGAPSQWDAVKAVERVGGKIDFADSRERRPVIGVTLLRSQVSEALLLQLATLVKLEDLSLTDGDIGDESLRLLQPFPKLEMLSLEGTRISDEGLKSLVEIPRLRELSLRNTQITDAGMPHLGKLSRLVSLSLSGTKITDTGLAELKGAKRLRKLYLWDCGHVTARGVAELQAGEPNLVIEWKAK